MSKVVEGQRERPSQTQALAANADTRCTATERYVQSVRIFSAKAAYVSKNIISYYFIGHFTNSVTKQGPHH